MDVLRFLALVIAGFTACAEFGSYAFVHPVVRNLPREHHVRMEQGLLKTFGRIMPFLMTLCVVLVIAYAVRMNTLLGPRRVVTWVSAASFSMALVSTIIFNVPINLATARLERGASSRGLEADEKSVGVFSGITLLATALGRRASVPIGSPAAVRFWIRARCSPDSRFVAPQSFQPSRMSLSFRRSASRFLPQLSVLGSGLFQHRDLSVGIVPQQEVLLVSSACSGEQRRTIGFCL